MKYIQLFTKFNSFKGVSMVKRLATLAINSKNKTENVKSFTEIPRISKWEMIRGFLPGGKLKTQKLKFSKNFKTIQLQNMQESTTTLD